MASFDRFPVRFAGCLQLRPEEVGEQRNQQAPGDHAAGEVQRGQARADDVADPEIRRTDRRRGHHACGAHIQLLVVAACGQPDHAAPEVTDPYQEGVAGRKDIERPEEVDQRTAAHVVEQQFRRLRSLLAREVNLRGGHRFRKRQLRIFHHDAPEQRHKQNAEDAANEHQRGRLPVRIRRIESRPGSRNHEGRDREDGARGDGFADRPDRSGHVLLENRPLAEPEEGHADHRGRVGGGDRHTRAQAQVGVGRAENHRHHQANENGPEGEFPHIRLFGNVGSMFCLHIEATLARHMIPNGLRAKPLEGKYLWTGVSPGSRTGFCRRWRRGRRAPLPCGSAPG